MSEFSNISNLIVTSLAPCKSSESINDNGKFIFMLLFTDIFKDPFPDFKASISFSTTSTFLTSDSVFIAISFFSFELIFDTSAITLSSDGLITTFSLFSLSPGFSGVVGSPGMVGVTLFLFCTIVNLLYCFNRILSLS